MALGLPDHHALKPTVFDIGLPVIFLSLLQILTTVHRQAKIFVESLVQCSGQSFGRGISLSSC